MPLAALAFAPGTVSPAERGVYAVALSLAVAAVGGLVLQLAIGLDRASWAILLAAVTALAALRGLRAPRRPASDAAACPGRCRSSWRHSRRQA